MSFRSCATATSITIDEGAMRVGPVTYCGNWRFWRPARSPGRCFLKRAQYWNARCSCRPESHSQGRPRTSFPFRVRTPARRWRARTEGRTRRDRVFSCAAVPANRDLQPLQSPSRVDKIWGSNKLETAIQKVWGLEYIFSVYNERNI